MLVLSHRGFHVQARENSLDAFHEAVKLGVDGIETDVRLTADGVAVLFHDRIVNGRLLADLTLEELRREAGYAVATLQAALEEFPDILWNLEIKVPAALDASVATLAKFQPRRRILITSFWHPVVEEACRQLDVDGGILVAHRPRAGLAPTDWTPRHPRAQTIVWYWETCDRDVLADAASCGIRNIVYGAETAAELAELARWPVAGVITDHPERVRREEGNSPR
jgi:glycerophosphoryl diester phosphodiesterase